jgi:hypothetical protein
VRSRALRTLTQAHLAQHVLFHRFHDPAIGLSARRLFGLGAADFQQARLIGRSPAELAAAHHRRRGWLARRAMDVLRSATLRGVRAGVMPPEQGRLLLRQRRRGLSHWLDSRIHKYRRRRLHHRPDSHPRSRMACRLLRGVV